MRVSGSRADLRRTLWQALTDADRLLRETTDPAITLRCVSAIATTDAVYSNVLDAEARDDERARALVPAAEAEAALLAVLDFAAKIIGADEEGRHDLAKGARLRIKQAVEEARPNAKRR
ncbi:MAG: hypothetical protein AAGI52_16200 [Bacteroidota bacterium]